MVDVPDFDVLYRADPDPWRVGSSFYEQRKLDIALASLTTARYRAVWDPASGTGELAARLAGRADTVLATDASAEAVKLTATRCSGLANVAVERIRQPAVPVVPEGGFDLVVVAEFAYYLGTDDRIALWESVAAASGAAAEVVVVHWRHRPHDGYLSGLDANLEGVARLTGANGGSGGWQDVVQHDDRDFVLSVVLREPR